MVNTLTKLHLIRPDVNGTGRYFCSADNATNVRFRKRTLQRRPQHGRAAGSECGTLKRQHRRRDDERAAAATTSPDGADADQGRREGITGPVQQLDDDSSQRGGVYAELYLHFPEWSAGEAIEQHDCESGSREADLAGARRKYFTV